MDTGQYRWRHGVERGGGYTFKLTSEVTHLAGWHVLDLCLVDGPVAASSHLLILVPNGGPALKSVGVEYPSIGKFDRIISPLADGLT